MGSLCPAALALSCLYVLFPFFSLVNIDGFLTLLLSPEAWLLFLVGDAVDLGLRLEGQLTSLHASRDQNSPAWGLMHCSFFGVAGALTDSKNGLDPCGALYDPLYPLLGSPQVSGQWCSSLNSCFSSLSHFSLTPWRVLCLFLPGGKD